MNTILVTTDGPLECRGQLALVSMEGKPLATLTEAWFCRCGRSADKPYCDGSHARTGFKDAGTPTAQPTLSPRRQGVLRVTLRTNGPLRLDGPVEVTYPTAGVVFAGEETALCRCGQSNNKPFCDGTHRQMGFTA